MIITHSKKKRKKIVEKCFKYHFFLYFCALFEKQIFTNKFKLYVLDIRTCFLLK